MNLRFAAIVSTCTILAACSTGTPASNPTPAPAQIERLSGVATAEITPEITRSLSLAATPQEVEQGFLGQMFGGSSRGRAPAVRTGPDAQVIPFGESVAYGKIATVCGVGEGSLGTMVANVSGYKIYDSIPNSTAMRPHYITGFDDGCARQFSAALSLTGDVGTHEVVRYLPANRGMPFSTTDTAYEAIKASFCRVSHGTPCGSRIDAFAKNATFITAYEKFGAHPRWVEIFLHDGEVKAIDFKSR